MVNLNPCLEQPALNVSIWNSFKAKEDNIFATRNPRPKTAAP